jgi:hypothetical protein
MATMQRWAKDYRTFSPCAGGCGALDDGTTPVKSGGRERWYCEPCWNRAWAERWIKSTATAIRKFHRMDLAHLTDCCTLCSPTTAQAALAARAEAMPEHNRRW